MAISEISRKKDEYRLTAGEHLIYLAYHTQPSCTGHRGTWWKSTKGK